MGSSKGRRGSGTLQANSPHRLEQHEAEGGWRGRVKVLASSTLGAAATKEEGGRAIALTEEDFRKSGFRARELVAVLAGPTRLIAGRVCPIPSAALRPGGVGLTSASAQSLLGRDGGRDLSEAGGAGARVRVRRLADTSVGTLAATSLNLVLEAGGGAAGQSSSSPHAYLEGLAPGRRALLQRAVGYCSGGTHTREGDLLTVSFEGNPHSFRVARLKPPVPVPPDRRNATATAVSPAAKAAEAAGSDDGALLVEHLAKLSISSEAGRTPSKAVVSSLAASTDALEEGARTAATTENVDDSTVEKPENRSSSGPEPGPGPAGGEGVAARMRLEAFYREHNPEKLVGDDIDGILTKYAGREETLFAKLEKKYGAGSSLLRTAAAGGNTGTERQGQQHAQSPPPLPATLGRAAYYPLSGEQPTSAQILEEKRAGARRSPATPSMQSQTPSGGGGRGGDEAAAIRSWGAGETLWLVDAETLIQLSGADAPPTSPDELAAAPTAASAATMDAGNPQTNANLQGDPAKGSFVGDTPRSRLGGEGERPPRHGVRAGEEGSEWGSVGGLSSQIQQLREAIELPLRSPEVLRRYGVRPPRGVLLHGPPGTGKTTLARAAARACGCHVIVVNGSELMSRFVGESEGALRQTFAEASRRAPCLIVFDEVDTLCPRRDQANSEAQRRVVSTMLALLDGVDAQEQVVVIACTNRPQALDPALRRPGRLDSEVEVGVPDAAGRAEILQVLLRGVPHAMSVADAAAVDPAGTPGGGGEKSGRVEEKEGGVMELAARTHGFVGADLQLLVKEAALQALRRTRGGGLESFSGSAIENDGGKEQGPGDNTGILSSGESHVEARMERTKIDAGLSGRELPTLTPEDFRAALPLVSPSGLREVAVEVPSVKWGDIGGMEGVKQSLREVVEWPLRHPEAFLRMGMSPPRGVLLYGPPGCSKTLMARALATESGMNFLAVKGPELLSKWLGESERAMQALFKRARAAAPTIIFFDEVDALASKRGGGGEGGAGATERVLTQLLTELDGIQPVKRLVVVAATNRPDVIDPALLRPGRLDRLVYVPPPDTPSRREILRLSLARVPCASDVEHELLARRTEGFSGAEVVALCREASICALEEDRSATQVRQSHLLEALGQMRPQITPAVLASYSAFQGGS